MDFLSNLVDGLLVFAKTPGGAAVILGSAVVIVRALILWTPTTVDDKWLAKYGKVVFSAASIVEKAVPDGTQTPALEFLDQAAKAISKSGEVDVSDKKLMTVVKKELIKIAKASAKVDTSAEELAKLKN